jgi:hypothetical protein
VPDLSVIGFDDVAIAGLAYQSDDSRAAAVGLGRARIGDTGGAVEGSLKGTSVERILDLQLVVRGTAAPTAGSSAARVAPDRHRRVGRAKS